MKFDHIIMNPPYCRNLHLKILNEAIKHSDDVVNLSPIRWLQDPLAEYKRNSDFKKFKDIRDHIESLEVISRECGAEVFNIRLNSDLGIYHITKFGGFDCAKIINANMRLVKISVNCHFPNLKPYCESDARAFVTVRTITDPRASTAYDIVSHNNGIFINGKTLDCKYWRDALHKAKNCNDDRVPSGIYFSTVDEANNFINWSDTKTIKYFVKQLIVDQNIYTQFLPFMNDYTHPWTDEDLYKYFNLTDDEIKIIEDEFKDETK